MNLMGCQGAQRLSVWIGSALVFLASASKTKFSALYFALKFGGWVRRRRQASEGMGARTHHAARPSWTFFAAVFVSRVSILHEA